MKRLILSLAVVLGLVAPAQAQYTTMPILASRGGQGALDAPLVNVQALFQSGVFQASLRSPIRHRLGLALESDGVNATRVSSLLFGGRPSHISGCIVPVAVNSINRMQGRGLRPDVFQEGREVMNPLGAYGNTSASIAVIIGILWIQTPRLHGGPRGIFHGAALPMRPKSSRDYFPMVAAARSSGSMLKTCRGGDDFTAAITATQPMSFIISSDRAYDC